MPLTLIVIALIVNLLALLYARLTDWREGWRVTKASFARAGGKVLWGAMAGVFLLPFLLTIPYKPPFSQGMGLGWGILIGGILGFSVFCAAASSLGKKSRAAAAIGPLAAAGVGTSFIMLVFRGDPTDTLIGCALGAVAMGMIGSGLLRTLIADRQAAGISPLFFARSLELYAIASSTLAGAILLGMLHFWGHSTMPEANYWIFPPLLLGVGTLALAVISAFVKPGNAKAGTDTGIPEDAKVGTGTSVHNSASRGTLVPVPIFAALVMLIVTAALQVRLMPGLRWQVILFGLLALAITQAVFLYEEKSDNAIRPLALTMGLLLVLLAVIGLSFRLLHGFGEALMLLPALLIAGSYYIQREEDEGSLTAALSMAAFVFMLLFVLSRLFLGGREELQALNFQRQYDLFALVAGAGSALGVMTVLQRWGERLASPAQALIRWLALALLVMAAPLAILIVMGLKAFLAFAAGLIIGEMIFMALAARTAVAERKSLLTSAPHAFLLAAMLAALQLQPKIIMLTMGRAQRIGIVVVFAVITAVWVLVEMIKREEA